MPARRRWAIFTVKDADLVPALMPGDVLHFDPAAPLDLSVASDDPRPPCRRDRLRVVVLAGDHTLHAALLDGGTLHPVMTDVEAVWPVRCVEASAAR
jgi:hypothetical protein